VPVVNERHALDLCPADTDVQRLLSADDVQAVRYEQLTDVLPRGIQIIGHVGVKTGQPR
jgi:hypothetical protein